MLNATDHAANPTQNVQIGTDAPSLTVTISDNDDLEEVAFSTTAAEDDENDVTNAEGTDPGANSINLPIAIVQQSGKDIVLKYSIDHNFCRVELFCSVLDYTLYSSTLIIQLSIKL